MKIALRSIAIGILILTNFSLFAQQEGRNKQPEPEARAKRQTAEMKVRLNLDDNQTSKVYEVLLDRENEIARKKDMARQKNQTHQSKIESILTEDQRKEFKKLQEEKRDRTKARRHIHSTPQKDVGNPKNY